MTTSEKLSAHSSSKARIKIYLTIRELEIINNLRQGATIKETANKLNISARTVERHIEHMKDKLHCRTAFEFGVVLGKMFS